mmetsp:Transcript_7483/g.17115  ORF Transcript_7483/g.17115 Transcript_7483/m.17115 type:complete len:328 (+) Transcript_7483:38-1021(+)
MPGVGHGGTHLTSWIQELKKLDIEGHVGVTSLGFSPDNALLAAGLGPSLCLLSQALVVKWHLPDAHSGSLVRCVAFAGRSLVSGGADGNIKLWDVASGEELAVLQGHSADVHGVAVAFSNTDVLATSSADCTVKLWQHGVLGQSLAGHEGPVFSVGFSRDDSLLVSASEDRTARIWHHADGACLAILIGHKNAVRKACFGNKRSSSLVVTGSSDGTAMLWKLPSQFHGDVVELSPLHICKAHTAGITDLAIGENGETLCTASADKSLKLWTLKDGVFARSLTGGGSLTAVAFSTAGSARIASATSRGMIKIWGIVPKGSESGMFACR